GGWLCHVVLAPGLGRGVSHAGLAHADALRPVGALRQGLVRTHPARAGRLAAGEPHPPGWWPGLGRGGRGRGEGGGTAARTRAGGRGPPSLDLGLSLLAVHGGPRISSPTDASIG